MRTGQDILKIVILKSQICPHSVGKCFYYGSHCGACRSMHSPCRNNVCLALCINLFMLGSKEMKKRENMNDDVNHNNPVFLTQYVW